MNRSLFDWIVWTIIHLVLIGGISYAGFAVYGRTLGAWVAASAIVAGFTSMYLFAKDVPGETLMKIWLGLCVAANAAYLVHNGARAIGVKDYNNAQVEKFEKGMARAAQSQSKGVARQLGLSVKSASELEKMFNDGVSVIAALLAFFELASAIVIFSIASKRAATAERSYKQEEFPRELTVGK
jgi:hypothetical protein